MCDSRWLDEEFFWIICSGNFIKKAQRNDFVEQWTRFYGLPNIKLDQKLYITSIRDLDKGDYTLKELESLFEWKAGAQFAEKGKKFARSIDIDALNQFRRNLKSIDSENCAELKSMVDVFYRVYCAPLTQSKNSFIWPLFVVHLAAPDYIPIFDQHAWRAYRIITKRIPFNGLAGLAQFEDFWDYVCWFSWQLRDGSLSSRELDRALWGFGMQLRRAALQVSDDPYKTKAFLICLYDFLQAVWDKGVRW